MDTTSLKAGEEWNRQIYDALPQSDVLLLLVAEATAQSYWVAREVDLAKGACVTVLPILIRAGYDIKPVMERFDLATIQYLRVLNGTEDELATIVAAIEEIKGKTADNQRHWLERLTKDRGLTPYTAKHSSTQKFAVYQVKGKEMECQVCIAAGNMFDMSMAGIDVFVNSENDYMQMARIFESQTISSLLRFYGSSLDDAGRIHEDTVQDELNQIIEQSGIRIRPVALGTVIATSAGRMNAYMRKCLKARYIFHTATVSVEGDDIMKTLECRLMSTGIRRCVRNTLQKVRQIDEQKGQLLPPCVQQSKGHDGKTAETYQPIESIIFPIFGAGRGGRPAKEILPAMIDGVKEFLLDMAADPQKKEHFHLQRIYIAAYYDEDAQYMQGLLEKDKEFFKRHTVE